MSRLAAPWTRPWWSFVGLLVAFYAFPARMADVTGEVLIGLAFTAVGLGLLATMMVRELRHLRQGGEARGVRVLAMLLVLLVMASSLAFYLLDQVDPDQIAGLDTRTDALYFTLSTMTTVGYGDIHAEGQVARVVVCALIVFNVVVVASLFREYTMRRSAAGS